jgi:hypothetical protein
MDLTSRFAVGVHMALTGKTEAFETMRTGFLARVRRFFKREPTLVDVDQVDLRRAQYEKGWALAQEFVAIEKQARFAIVEDPALKGFER